MMGSSLGFSIVYKFSTMNVLPFLMMKLIYESEELNP